jgi:O-antigen/teichoic acid export membrane protein
MFIIVPLLATLIVVAEPLVLLLLKEKWAPMIPYLQLLSIVGILYPLHLINVQTINSLGKSNLNFRLEIIKNSLRVLNIIIMYQFGVIYIIIGEVILSFMALVINTYYTQRLINYGILKQLNDIKIIFLSGFIASVLAYFIINGIESIWISLIIGSVISFGLFLLLQYLLDSKFFSAMFELRKLI